MVNFSFLRRCLQILHFLSCWPPSFLITCLHTNMLHLCVSVTGWDPHKQTCLTWELSCKWTWFFVFLKTFDPNSFFQFFIWWFPSLRENKLSFLVGFPLVSIFYVHLTAVLPSSSRQMAERSTITLISGFAGDIFVHPLSLCMRSQNLTTKFFTQKLPSGCDSFL